MTDEEAIALVNAVRSALIDAVEELRRNRVSTLDPAGLCGPDGINRLTVTDVARIAVRTVLSV